MPCTAISFINEKSKSLCDKESSDSLIFLKYTITFDDVKEGEEDHLLFYMTPTLDQDKRRFLASNRGSLLTSDAMPPTSDEDLKISTLC